MSERNNRFSALTFEDFKLMAQDSSLNQYEKIGFPTSYRENKEHLILKDIIGKIQSPNTLNNGIAIDIGAGCSSLPILLSEFCSSLSCRLLLIDSKEVLSQLSINNPLTTKNHGCFPDVASLIKDYESCVNLIVCYSVIQYVYEDGNIWRFVDECLALLAPQGTCIIGDIPNESKRKRFFSSETGIAFHQDFMKTGEIPHVNFNQIEKSMIDDSFIHAILQRCRLQGFDAYVVPQSVDLPMANRREDIIITRP